MDFNSTGEMFPACSSIKDGNFQSSARCSVLMLLLWRGLDIILGLCLVQRGRDRRSECSGSRRWRLHLFLILNLPSIIPHICHAISCIFSSSRVIPTENSFFVDFSHIFGEEVVRNGLVTFLSYIENV